MCHREARPTAALCPHYIRCSAITNRSTFVSKGPIMGMSSLGLFRSVPFSYEIDSIFAQEFYNPAGCCICINPILSLLNVWNFPPMCMRATQHSIPVVHRGSVTCRYLHLSSLHCYFFAARHGLICVDSPPQCEALALTHPSQLAAERRRKGTGSYGLPKSFLKEIR